MSRFSLSELAQSCFAMCALREPGTASANAEERMRRQLGVAQFNLNALQNTITGLEKKKAAAVKARNLQEAKACITQRHAATKKLAKYEQTCTVIQNMIDEIAEAEFTKETVAALSTAHRRRRRPGTGR
jgi:hypothetical protein